MKKLLSGTTALVAAGMLVMPALAADDEEMEPQPVSVSISGFYNATLAMASQDNDANDSGHAIRQTAEIHFNGSTTLDNGLTVGVHLELEGEQQGEGTPDQMDETFIWVSGTFGRIVVGENDSASGVMGIFPAGAGVWGVIWPEFSLVNGGSVGQAGNFANSFDGDDEKIIWESPRVGGLRVGASYTPNAATDANDGATTDDDGGEYSQVVGLGLNWSGDLGDSAVAVGFGYNQGQLEAPSGSTVSDRSDWVAGGSLSMMGVTVSGNYAVDDRGRDGDGDISSLAVGATYGGLIPGTTVGVTYGQTEDEAANTTNSAVSLGARYTLGPGISLRGEVQFWDIQDADADTAGDQGNNATVGIMGVSIGF